jgi:hypothetical protein
MAKERHCLGKDDRKHETDRQILLWTILSLLVVTLLGLLWLGLLIYIIVRLITG